MNEPGISDFDSRSEQIPDMAVVTKVQRTNDATGNLELARRSDGFRRSKPLSGGFGPELLRFLGSEFRQTFQHFIR
jgi:hypothetical protein